MAGILSIVKLYTDFVEVKYKSLRYRYALRQQELVEISDFTIRALGKNTEYKGRYGITSYWREIEIVLQHHNKEYTIFSYRLNRKYAKEANVLGAELVRKIRNVIK